MKYKIYVRDQYFNRVAEIDDYQQLELKPSFNAVGAWQLTLPTNTDAANELIKPQAGIIVVRNGITLFSGPVNQKGRKWDANSDVLTVSGFDDMIFLQQHLAYPVPGGPPYTNDYDVRTGATETIIKAYVNANIGSGASTNRKINITTDTDLGRGSTVTGRARFDTLLELCASIALQGGDLGFKVVQVGNALQFQVYQPSDKTASVVFSPLLGNLLDFEYTETNPETNYVIAGGGGVGAARTIVESGDSNSISTFGRVESFLDQRDTTDITELNQAISGELSQKASQNSLNITPIDTDGIAFGRDYNLGDKVTVVLTKPNEVVEIETLYYYISAFQTVPVDVEKVKEIQEVFDTIKDVVRQLTITITPDGELITPNIGTPDSLYGTVPKIFKKMKQVNKRLSKLERV